MPLRGGQSDKYGGRYEDRWTAHCVYQVLREDAEAIRLESPGLDGEGCEFWLRLRDRKEYHQVKRQNAGEGRWNLSELHSRGVLTAFYAKLRDPQAWCVFASTHAAGQLDELADLARQAVSWSEFESEYLKADKRRAAFHALLDAWGAPDAELAFAALRRIRVATVSEPELTTWNALEAETVLDGDSPSAVAVLTQVLRDHVGHYLTPHQLWRALPAGYGPVKWRGTRQATVALTEANEIYIASRHETLIGGELIARRETEQLEELAREHRVVILDGSAGMGKSDVLLGFVEALRRGGTAFLAMRLDRLTPTLHPDSLGHELGLPASPPAALVGVAAGERAVLVIDQLDIVSTTSGRSPQFFQCVSEMLALALSAPNICIVLACRTFDLNNDARLRRLVHGSEERPAMTVGPLDAGQVVARLDALGFAPSELTEAQVALLRVPLHLALLAEIAMTSPDRRLDFATARDLYDEFWRSKQHDVADRLGRPCAWTQVIDALIDYMSNGQVLQGPVELLDAWQQDAETMASSRVLLQNGRSYAFFHETFFDYAFARRFVARGQTVDALLSADQQLFRRAQVRRILAHERDSTPERYLADLRYLLTEPTVRFHLRDLVVAWLAELTPTAGEWDLIEPFVRDRQSPLHWRAWQTLQTPAWFAYADQHGDLDGYLGGDDDELTDDAATLLARLGDQSGDRVAALLQPYVGVSDRWNQRLAWIAGRLDLAQARGLLDLFLTLMDAGVLDQFGVTGGDFWYIAHELPARHPDWALELLGRWLRNRDAAAPPGNPFESVIPRHLHLREYIRDSARAAPEAFVDYVWPVMLELMERTAEEPRDGRLTQDEIWTLKHYSDDHGCFSDQLLGGAEEALAALAKDHPDRFSQLLDTVRETEHETVVYLLYRGLAGNPERFSDTAIAFVVDDERRLATAHAEDDHWASRMLLEAVTPHASAAAISRLEAILLDYYTPWERSAHGRKEFGYSQFTLLTGVAEPRRSPAVAKRFAEWQRKFQSEDTQEPVGIQGGFVGSPIGDDAAAKMSDENWRQAVDRYASDASAERRSLLTGGPHQLSSVLEKQTAAQPARFARLAVSFPDHTNQAYFEAVLRGVEDSEDELAMALTAELIKRCHALPGRPCGRWIARPLLRHAEQPIPTDLLEILGWYAMHDPDPMQDRDPNDNESPHQRLLQHGLKSVRGGVAYDITRLVYGRAEHFAPLQPAIESLVSDPVLAVRAMAAEITMALLRHHRELAGDLFLTLVSGADDVLLATRHIHEFLRYRAAQDYPRYASLIQRMIDSQFPAAREAGAVQATLVALDDQRAATLADRCLNGALEERIGAAKVYAANVTTARFRDRCQGALRQLFSDPAKEVRDAAAGTIRRFHDGQLGEFQELVQAFMGSVAFEDNQEDLLYALTETTSSVPEISLNACERFLELLGGQAKDIRTRAAHHADQVSQILVRAYADSRDRALKERTLDLIDRSLELNIYGAVKALSEHDRSWAGG
jgi:hypothetical protein